MTHEYRPAAAHAAPPRPPRREVALTPEEFARLRDLLAAYGGIYLDDTRQRVLEQAVAGRLSATGDDPASYERRLRLPHGDELARLAELVLNHETFFFRNRPQMRALREALLPEIDRRKPAGQAIRIWSAGCATGEEAYSLAILAHETLGGRPRPVEILATDLSEPALARARAGVYSGRALANVAPEMLMRYFRPEGAAYAVRDEVRRLVRFERLNLLEPFPEATRGVDIIFCQNVMIYFQLETCRRLLERFYECLDDDGLLFLGFSETLWNVFDRFRPREVAGAYVYTKSAPPPPAPRPAATPRPVVRPAASVPHRAPVTLESTTAAAAGGAALLAEAERLLHAGRPDEALETLRRIPPQSPAALRAMALAARLHADRGDLELALAESRRVLEIDPLCDDAHVLIGAIYGRQGQWAAATQQFERARYLNPSSPLISFQLAGAYREAGARERALREYRNTLRKLEPYPPDALLDGVAAGWLSETCRRQIDELGGASGAGR